MRVIVVGAPVLLTFLLTIASVWVDGSTDVDKLRALFFKTLHPNGSPNLSSMKSSAVSNEPEMNAASYSHSGYLTRALFLNDGTCKSPTLTYGFPVNTCVVESNFAYVLRLTQDSCYGGVIEYYFDKSCTRYAGKSDLSDSVPAGCRSLGGGVATSLQCSTSSSPPVFDQSVLLDYYTGMSCGKKEMFMAFPANQCTRAKTSAERDSMTTCSNGKLSVKYFERGSNCKKDLFMSDSVPSTCQRSDNPYSDDDTSLRIMTTTPSSTSSGSDSSVSDLSAEGMAALHGPALRHIASLFTSGTSPFVLNEAPSPAESTETTLITSKQKLVPRRPTDDDVNYYDDDGDDRYYVYDDFVFIYSHDDDFYTDGNGIGNGDADDFGLNPPPSISTTPYPTNLAEASTQYSMIAGCQAPSAKKDVSFTVHQVIKGPSLNSFNSNKAMNEKTLKQAIASTITGATESSVTALVVTEISTVVQTTASSATDLLNTWLRGPKSITHTDSAAAAATTPTPTTISTISTTSTISSPTVAVNAVTTASHATSTATNATTSSATGATTTTTVTTSSVTGATTTAHTIAAVIPTASTAVSSIRAVYMVSVQDSHLSSVSLAGQLQGAVHSGAFNAAIQTYAALNGANDMNSATSDTVSVDTSSSSSSGTNLGTESIVGIAVGGFALIIILSAAVCFCCLTKPSSSSSVHPRGVVGSMRGLPV